LVGQDVGLEGLVFEDFDEIIKVGFDATDVWGEEGGEDEDVGHSVIIL
jgi:hypothetical protein